MSAAEWGAILFGVVIGWITYRTLVRKEGAAALSDIATVIGAVGGATVLAIFDSDHLFGLYAIGLTIGFFGYLVLFFAINGRKKTGEVMGEGDRPIKVQ